jgi:glycosyltransferase involved in cell wall biosynthesis
MTKILAFSKHLVFNTGGAEKSIVQTLRSHKNDDITLLGFDSPSSLYRVKPHKNVPTNWTIKSITPPFRLNRFPYYEYFLNKRKLKDLFRSYNGYDKLVTYSLYAPVVINTLDIATTLYIRSENDLLIRDNYYTDPVKHFAKKLYSMSENPALSLYRRELEVAMRHSTVIANSNFIAKQLHKRFGIQADICYPPINIKKLKAEYDNIKDTIEQKGIVFVGDSIVKGLPKALQIAKVLKKNKFYFFSRYIVSRQVEDNITWMPWAEREIDYLKYASHIIVPSFWQEAYGRVSREAYLLGIPVLVSNRGGLPETVDNDPSHIVSNYLSTEAWVDAIKRIS